MSLKTVVRLTLAFCLCAATVLADKITLKNGDQVSGKIVNSDDKTIIVKSDFMGEVKVDRSAIVSITGDEPLNVTLKDGKTVKGKIETEAQTVQVQPPAGAPVAAPIDTVLAVRDDAAQHAWEREQERITHPKLNDFWIGAFTFGLANASGNSSTTVVSTAGLATRETGKDKIGVSVYQVYSTQSTTIPYGTTANRIGGGVRYDRNFDGKLFAYAVNSYDYDQFLDLDLRVVLGGGIGYHIWKSPNGFWDAGAGLNWNHEKYGETISDPGPPPVILPGYTNNSLELNLGEESQHKLYKRMNLYQRAAFFPNLTNSGEYRFNFDAGATIPIWKWMEFSVGYSDRYTSNPPPTRKKNDSLVTTGIRVSFDQTKR